MFNNVRRPQSHNQHPPARFMQSMRYVSSHVRWHDLSLSPMIRAWTGLLASALQ